MKNPIPDGWVEVHEGEMVMEGDKYMDRFLYAGQWRPVCAMVGLPALGETTVIRKVEA